MGGLLTTEELLAQMPEAFSSEGKHKQDFKPSVAYPTIRDITDHLTLKGFPSEHIYTKDLNKDKKLIESLSDDKNKVYTRVVADEMEKYLSAKEYYSSGSPILANQTGLHLYFDIEEGWKEELEKYKNRKHFELGSFIHEAILEPTKFNRVCVEPVTNKKKRYDRNQS